MQKMFTAAVAMIVLATAVITIFSGTFQPAFAKAKVLRLAVPSPPGDWPLSTAVEDMAERFNARAGDTYKIEVFAGGALVKLPEYMDAVRVGAVEIVCSPWSLFSFMDPRLGAVEIPFMFTGAQSAVTATQELLPLYDGILQEKFKSRGLSMFYTGSVDLYNLKPVKTMDDLKGLMVGCLSPGMAEMFKTLGAAPVTIMWTDMYEALQKKVIDAVTQSTRGLIVMGISGITKHATIFHGVTGYNGLQVNEKVFNKMPAEIQAIFIEEAIKTAEYMNAETVSKVLPHDAKIFREQKVDLFFLPKDEREKWMKQIEPYITKQLEITGDFGRKVKAIAERTNAMFPYTGERWD